MRKNTIAIPRDEIEKQYGYMNEFREINEVFYRQNGKMPLACVRNFGCQMNEHDSEKLAGMLENMGFALMHGRRISRRSFS